MNSNLVLLILGVLLGYVLDRAFGFGWLLFVCALIFVVALFYKPRRPR